jgi:crotonobetainyl-CoA:carnitine CoA-transferase CaiB-like acyl-CoA transferase
MVATAEHPTAGTLRLLGRPVKFPGAPQAPLEPPPTLGQHTAEVLRRELGLSEERIEELRRRGVIDRVGGGVQEPPA